MKIDWRRRTRKRERENVHWPRIDCRIREWSPCWWNHRRTSRRKHLGRTTLDDDIDRNQSADGETKDSFKMISSRSSSLSSLILTFSFVSLPRLHFVRLRRRCRRPSEFARHSSLVPLSTIPIAKQMFRAEKEKRREEGDDLPSRSIDEEREREEEKDRQRTRHFLSDWFQWCSLAREDYSRWTRRNSTDRIGIERCIWWQSSLRCRSTRWSNSFSKVEKKALPTERSREEEASTEENPKSNDWSPSPNNKRVQNETSWNRTTNRTDDTNENVHSDQPNATTFDGDNTLTFQSSQITQSEDTYRMSSSVVAAAAASLV